MFFAQIFSGKNVPRVMHGVLHAPWSKEQNVTNFEEKLNKNSQHFDWAQKAPALDPKGPFSANEGCRRQ